MSILNPVIKKVNPGTFFKMNAIFFIGSLATSFLNYLYYPVLGRLLPIESFGEVQVILSIFNQLAIFLSVVTMITVNIVANEDDEATAQAITSEFEKLSLYFSIVLFVISIFLSTTLKNALKFESELPFILMMVSLITSIPLAFKTAYLRGKNDFTGTSISSILSSGFKIVVSLIFVLIGFSTNGAIGGLIASQILAIFYVNYRTRKHGYKKIQQKRRVPDWSLIKPQVPYAAFLLFTSLLTTLQFSIDITLVKYLFSEEIAGQYAGISTIARIVLFITGSFSVIILSTVKRNFTPSQNSKILLKSSIFTFIVGGAVTLFFVLLPLQTVHILFGTKYDNFANLLPSLSITMFLISFISLLANFHIALRNYFVAFIIFLGTSFTLILLLIKHSTVEDVVQSLLLGSIIMFVLLFVWTVFKQLTVRKELNETQPYIYNNSPV